MCEPRRLWSACASAQADQSLRCSLCGFSIIWVVLENRGDSGRTIRSRLIVGFSVYHVSWFFFGLSPANFLTKQFKHWPVSENYPTLYAYSEDSDQPAFLQSLLRTFTFAFHWCSSQLEYVVSKVEPQRGLGCADWSGHLFLTDGIMDVFLWSVLFIYFLKICFTQFAVQFLFRI